MKKIVAQLENLKADIQNTYMKDDLSLECLELKLFDINELTVSGFIDKNIRGIMECDDPDFMEHVFIYFDEECLNVTSSEIEKIPFSDIQLTAGEEVTRFVFYVVKGVLHKKLKLFINVLKESQSKFNGSL